MRYFPDDYVTKLHDSDQSLQGLRRLAKRNSRTIFTASVPYKESLKEVSYVDFNRKPVVYIPEIKNNKLLFKFYFVSAAVEEDFINIEIALNVIKKHELFKLLDNPSVYLNKQDVGDYNESELIEYKNYLTKLIHPISTSINKVNAIKIYGDINHY